MIINNYNVTVWKEAAVAYYNYLLIINLFNDAVLLTPINSIE